MVFGRAPLQPSDARPGSPCGFGPMTLPFACTADLSEIAPATAEPVNGPFDRPSAPFNGLGT